MLYALLPIHSCLHSFEHITYNIIKKFNTSGLWGQTVLLQILESPLSGVGPSLCSHDLICKMGMVTPSPGVLRANLT